MSYFVCPDNSACNSDGSANFWVGAGLYQNLYNTDAGYEELYYNGVPTGSGTTYPLPFGDGYYAENCAFGCEDPNSPTYHQNGCDPCGYYDCAGNIYYPAYGETCNSSSQDNFGVCCGGCFDSAACGSTGSGCDYGSGSANCGCNSLDLGCGCGSGWNGQLPADNQVLSGVYFGGGDVYHAGTLQPGVAKSKVILSAALGIPIM